MKPVADAVDLYFRWESAWGGSMLLGTEGVAVVLLNVGYSLRHTTVRVLGGDGAGGSVFELRREVPEMPRGQEVRIEVASYDLPDRAARRLSELAVVLDSAEFAEDW